jgi:hypothetical protein
MTLNDRSRFNKLRGRGAGKRAINTNNSILRQIIIVIVVILGIIIMVILKEKQRQRSKKEATSKRKSISQPFVVYEDGTPRQQRDFELKGRPETNGEQRPHMKLRRKDEKGIILNSKAIRP